ncbi:hypothetical protein TNCV_2124551 [Trichonephila clavipes]|uniref:Uncharacterized protein n=1 Tax=Trichonephila clavipes TaxID=2585209 RepID=A0A8X6UTC5_TRICX|nr:hypothetical protein TNCV_2124551 [Trichonephila clavipes]
MIQARNNLPAISYMTAMDLWLFACLLQVFGSILAFTFTYRIYARTYKPGWEFSYSIRHTTLWSKFREFHPGLTEDALCKGADTGSKSSHGQVLDHGVLERRSPDEVAVEAGSLMLGRHDSRCAGA